MSTWPNPRILLFALLDLALIDYATGCAGRARGEERLAVAGSSSGGAVGGSVETGFVPDEPRAYEANKNGLGSFEENPGFGWDTCRTRTAETLSVQPGGSEGSTYLSCQSVDEPAPLSDQVSASQIYFWAEGATETSENLYFDVKNLSNEAVTGSLRFYGTDLLCEGEQLLREVDLAKLELRPTWATRCVTVSGLRDHRALGIAVSGGRHAIGLDAFRFGPPCHASH